MKFFSFAAKQGDFHFVSLCVGYPAGETSFFLEIDKNLLLILFNYIVSLETNIYFAAVASKAILFAVEVYQYLVALFNVKKRDLFSFIKTFRFLCYQKCFLTNVFFGFFLYCA